MNGELALLASVAAVGGRWLRQSSGPVPVPDLERGNTSFQYVGSFTAQLPPYGWRRRTATAASPESWLESLRTRGATDLSLLTDLPATGNLPPRVATAFTNSGTWGLLASAGAHSTLWTIAWGVGERNRRTRASGLSPQATARPRAQWFRA